jgi:hypothetical protein
MFKRKTKESSSPFGFFEDLESRRLLSASASLHVKAIEKASVETKASLHHDSSATTTKGSTTAFSGLQTTDVAAYNELTSLATADNTTIAGTQTVYIRPVNSTTTYYTVVLTPSTGTKITLTSDEDGNPVTPPTSSKTTFGDVTDAAATDELASLAAALNLTAPTSTTSVTVRTDDGLTTYTVSLAPSSGTGHHVQITVDAAGNPAGNERIPFSALNSTIAGGLTSLASAESLTIAGTQNVLVSTSGGVTTYTVRLTSSGQSVEFTVDNTGAAATPSSGGGFGGGSGRGGSGGGIHRGSGGDC